VCGPADLTLAQVQRFSPAKASKVRGFNGMRVVAASNKKAVPEPVALLKAEDSVLARRAAGALLVIDPQAAREAKLP
jgi:hypothetical protein